ncbi:hypothetical protein [Roseivirga sp.]|uniref:hypothetical protein n=1 Tax=Roseivirga sp. TaxID=1964215 RepID=UPI003B8E69C4
MLVKNEFEGYSVEELEVKKKKFLRLQVTLMSFAGLIALAVGIYSYVIGNSQGYTLIPIVLIVGFGYPLWAFGNLRRNAQREIDSRK